MKIFLYITTILFTLDCYGGCDASYSEAETQPLQDFNIPSPVYKRYCYRDTSGEYYLYLINKQDKIYKNGLLSTTIDVHLLKQLKNGDISQRWSIHDFVNDTEAGLRFSLRFIELPDIDGDGLIEPIIVYRFYEKDLEDPDNFNAYSFEGRAKIIMYYKGIKVAIRGETGEYETERKTTATKTFFSLPSVVQKYLSKKIESMYNDGTFGFNNGFFPQHEDSDPIKMEKVKSEQSSKSVISKKQLKSILNSQ